MSLAAGTRLGPYVITAPIGAGGMGEVWRAHDTRLGRDVALKVLPAEALADETARARLVREARLASQLNHPHICTIHDVGESDGQTYIAMELVEGQALSAHVVDGPLPIEQVLRYGQQMADALAHAHGRGVVHRDFKSPNVMVTPEGQVKVLDFGLAKRLTGEELAEVTTVSRQSLTGPGMVAGTLAYMAPEQLRGQAADARSDIWALGVVLFELATGKRPFQGRTGFELSSAILKEPVPTLTGSVPAPLAGVIQRCLAKEPGERYQQGTEVRAAIDAVASGQAPAAWPTWRAVLRRRRGLALAVTALLLLTVLAMLTWQPLRARFGGPAPRIQSLAVLPLENLSGDKEQEYWADGMTEQLVTDLAKIGALNVISRASVMQYKGTRKPLAQIARELNVDAVITGSVLREAGQVRITAQLIRASTEQNLWADSYQRDVRGVLALQGEIAGVIADKVSAAVTPTERARLASARPVNAEAYEAYLKGKFYLNKMTPDGFEKGLAFMQQAIDKDPTNPLPHAGLALAYSQIGHERYPDAFARARAAARKAEELGGEPPAEMYVAFGMIKLYSDWDYAGAEKDLRRAIELNPSLGEAHRDYSYYLFLAKSRRNEALAEMRRAQEVEPLTPLFYSDRGWQYWWTGQLDKAIEEDRKALELDSSFNQALALLGYVYAEKGMYAEAIAAHEKLAATDHVWRWLLARTYAVAGRKDEARRTLTKFLGERPNPTDAFSGWFLAEVYAALGEKDEAFRWLETAYKERHSFLPWVRDNPTLAPLRGDPRFQDLVRRMHAPE